MMKLTIYLFFAGNCLEAMTHYADVLGGEIDSVFKNADAPDPESRMPGGDDLVLNMAMKLGETLIMASDAPAQMYQTPQGFRVSIDATSLSDFNRLQTALAQDAKSIEMPAGETFWAERFMMFTDRFGTPWMLGFTGSKSAG